MVYPILKINQDNSSAVQIIDTEFSNDPIMAMDDDSLENNFSAMLTLLQAFLVQYDVGYGDGFDEGYIQGIEDNNIE